MSISWRICYGFLLLILINTTWNINAVLSCQFGPGCLHECNCALSCDTLTGCTGQCAEGWDGPTCQRQNVALKQTTTQSSTLTPDFVSQYAVDGKTGHVIDTPCTHTNTGTATQPATWSVTLDRVYRINRFQIYNRNELCGTEGPCGPRLAGFTLSVGNSFSQKYETCYIDTTATNQSPGKIINGSCNQGVLLSGNIVRITARTGQPLTLCEVLIYVCSAGTYGQNCGQTCGLCAQGRQFCDKTSGNCPDRQDQPRCEAGYSGQRCETECNGGNWGADCQQNCGHCYSQTACIKTSGVCPTGNPRCSAGYSGTKCDTECNDGKWGIDCQQNCGHCHSQTACNKTSGECPAGNPRCSAGFSGTVCETKCNNGSWGADCLQNCGHCYSETACNKTSGECPTGNPRCSTGYSGRNCDTRINVTVTQTPKGTESNYTSVIIGCAISFIAGIIVGILGYRIFVYRRQSISQNERPDDRTQRSVIDRDKHVQRESNRISHTYNNDVMDEDGSSYENPSENIYDKPRLSPEGPEANYTTMS